MDEQIEQFKTDMIMKKIIVFVFGLLLLASCGTARKLNRARDDVSVYGVAMSTATNDKSDLYVDSTKAQNAKITITEIEFFEPSVIGVSQATGNRFADLCKSADSAFNEDRRKGKYADAFKRADSAFWASYVGNNVGGGGGSVINSSGIKSIRKKVIETNVEQRNVSSETKESTETNNAAIVDASETNTEEHQEPTPDPYRWRYIFGIVLIVAIVAIGINLYVKRTPVLKWLRAIF